MGKLLLSSLFLVTALATANRANAQCDCGDGSDGAFTATTNTTLAGGTYNYTTFNIDAGVTVTATGTAPLIIHCTGNVTINGTLSVSGEDGTDGITFSSAGIGGIGVAGGYDGADGVYVGSATPGNPGFGPGAGGLGTQWGGGGGAGHGAIGTDGQTAGIGGAGGAMYGNMYLVSMEGGSGGGSGSGGNSCGSGGGGAGGGILIVRSCDTIMIGAGGAVTSDGGNGGSDGTGNCGGSGGGSGGSLWLIADHLDNNGSISAMGGTSSFTTPGGAGAEGRIRLDYNSTAGTGTVGPQAGLTTTVFTTASTFVSPTCVGDADGSAETVPSGSAGTYTYLWSTTGTNDTIMDLAAGSYIVTVTDTNGCTVTDTVDVTDPTPVGATMSSTDETSTTASDGTATASGTGGTPPYSYAWTPGGGTGPTISGLDTGWYYVVVTDDNGCTGTDSVYVGQSTSVASASGENDMVHIYPNPANSYVTINAVKALHGEVTVQVIDITGRILATETFPANKEYRINISDFIPGNYLLRITNDGMSQNSQLTILR